MFRLKGSNRAGSKLTGSKMIAAAFAGGLALMTAGVSAAQADPWHGGPGRDGPDWNHGHGRGGPTVVVRNGYYYAPAPRPRVVYVAPQPVYVAPPEPVYVAPQPIYVAPPQPVYVAPQPLVSLQFRL